MVSVTCKVTALEPPHDDAVMGIFPNDLQYYLELPLQSSCDTAPWHVSNFRAKIVVGNGLLSGFALNTGVFALFFL